MRLLVALMLVACATPKPAEPPRPPPKSEMTPAEMCARVGALSKDFSDADRSACLEKTTSMRQVDPTLYACLGQCLEIEKTEATAEKCMKACLPPSKTAKDEAEAEALRILGSIETGATARFQEETDLSGKGLGPFVHTLCPATKEPIPKELPAAGASIDSTGAWDTPTWKCLRMSFDGPLFNQYSVGGNGLNGAEATLLAQARRRLPNGKLHVIRLTIQGTAAGDTQRVSLITTDE